MNYMMDYDGAKPVSCLTKPESSNRQVMSRFKAQFDCASGGSHIGMDFADRMHQ